MGSSRVGRVQTHHSAEEEDTALVHSVRQRNFFSPETEDTQRCALGRVFCLGGRASKLRTLMERETERFFSGMESLMGLIRS